MDRALKLTSVDIRKKENRHVRFGVGNKPGQATKCKILGGIKRSSDSN